MREEHSRSIDNGVQRVKEHLTSQVESLPAIAAAHNETLARINTMEQAMRELQTTVHRNVSFRSRPVHHMSSGKYVAAHLEFPNSFLGEISPLYPTHC